ncbi:phosphodiester glycosidase family protein [Paenibacillus sp. FSL L8-0696]|uniref:phosphodiester glycosidase family protein n=1 Tax=Paenibacillus sp. FSL L8-0696 TaxID=2954524 RepID=UPI003119617D
MSQGSQDISQQFIGGGVIPGQLVGQDAVSKTYVDGQNAALDADINNVAASAAAAQGAINTHEASPAAHSAAAITYNGVVAAGNVRQAIDQTNQRVSTIVAGAGASNTEILDARQPATGAPFPILGARLNNVDTQLADKTELEGYQYTEITTTEYGAHNTTYYITRIPNIDSNGQPIRLEHGIAQDNMSGYSLETARSFATRHRATLAINAGIFNTSTGALQGTSIIDGTIVSKESSVFWRLGIKADNTLVLFQPSVTAQDIIDAGCLNCISAFYPLIINGASVGTEISSLIDNWADPYPRQIIAQISSTKEILIFSCNGKGVGGNVGLTYPQCIEILIGLGVTLAYALDGGGSVSTVKSSVLINQATDNRGYSERSVADFLYVTKEHPANFTDTLNRELGKIYKALADMKLMIPDTTDFSFNYINLENTLNADLTGVRTKLNGVNRTKMYLDLVRWAYYNYLTGKNIVEFNDAFKPGRFKMNELFYYAAPDNITSSNVQGITNLNDIKEENRVFVISANVSNTPGVGDGLCYTNYFSSSSCVQEYRPINNTKWKHRWFLGGSYGAWTDN